MRTNKASEFGIYEKKMVNVETKSPPISDLSCYLSLYLSLSLILSIYLSICMYVSIYFFTRWKAGLGNNIYTYVEHFTFIDIFIIVKKEF